MRKKLKTFALVSLLCCIGYMFFVGLAIACQSFFRQKYFPNLADIFIIPWSFVLSIVLYLGILFILYCIVSSQYKRQATSILPEVLSIILSVVIMPLIPFFANQIINVYYGSEYISNLQVFNAMLSWVNFLPSLSFAFFLLFCGLSIALKQSAKQGIYLS